MAGGLKLVFLAAKPHWVQLIQDVEAAVQDALRWQCRASGKPRPSYRWLKNGEALVLEVRPAREAPFAPIGGTCPEPCAGGCGKPGHRSGGSQPCIPLGKGDLCELSL